MLPVSIFTVTSTLSSATLAGVGSPAPINLPHSSNGFTVFPKTSVSVDEAVLTNVCKKLLPAYLYKITKTPAKTLANILINDLGKSGIP